MFLLLLAALVNVDRSQIEAAEIDGASYWRIFFKIVLPRHLAGDGDRRSDPRPRPGPDLRHHLGADRRADLAR